MIWTFLFNLGAALYIGIFTVLICLVKPILNKRVTGTGRYNLWLFGLLSAIVSIPFVYTFFRLHQSELYENPILSILWLLWFIGAVSYLGYQVRKYYLQRKKMLYFNLPASCFEREMLYELSKDKTLVIYRNSLIKSPLVFGVIAPIVILPCNFYNAKELRLIMLHELTHLKKKHLSVKWIVLFIVGLQWFNPFIYIIQRELSRLCEISCDEIVVRALSNSERVGYTDLLLRLGKDGFNFESKSKRVLREKEKLMERLEEIKRRY